jgi:hypothetical protein
MDIGTGGGNMKAMLIASLLAVFIATAEPVFAVKVAPRISDREIVEGLANIRGDIKAMQQEVSTLHREIGELKEGQKTLAGRMDSLIYAVLGSIVVLIGIVIWDRRTALAPAIAKSRELEEREELLEKALKEYARQEPRLAEIFKSMKIMQS